MTLRTMLLALAMIAAPRVALACPVCFGQSDSPMAWGTNMAIFFMLLAALPFWTVPALRNYR